jgi:hypothetical protein
MAKKDIPGPTYKVIKSEIGKVKKALEALDPKNEAMRVRIDSALRDLDIARSVLHCGQSQSALDPGVARKTKSASKR